MTLVTYPWLLDLTALSAVRNTGYMTDHTQLPVFNVIMSTSTGSTHDIDVHASDACSAVYFAGAHIHDVDENPSVITNLHARKITDDDSVN